MNRLRTTLLSFGVVTAVLAALTQPALAAPAGSAKPFQAGRVMDLRVSATDAAGGILHQTTDRAFLIGN